MAAGPILIVDDVEDNRDVYSQILEFEGFEVVIAESGEECLEQVSRARPALILLDLGLPRLDGWEITRRLKGDPRTREIPIIVLTAHAERKALASAVEAGADSVLTKPCLPAVIVEEVKRRLAEGPRRA